MMCGCGVTRYCPGGCACGCDHDTFEGRTRQAESFATYAQRENERALWAEAQQRVADEAEAALDRVRVLCDEAEAALAGKPFVIPSVPTDLLRAAIEGSRYGT